MERFLGMLTVAVAVAVAGCGLEYEPSGLSGSSEDGAGEPTAEATPQATEEEPKSEPADEPEVVERRKADVGVGRKGHYESGAGVVTTPVSAYFRSRERIIFTIQIPKQMQIYEQLNDGPPKTHEEFMREIVEPLHVQLPELGPGQRYVYDPERAELMVETRR